MRTDEERKVKPYKKINGCIQELDCQQIFEGVRIVTFLTFYGVFVAPGLVHLADAGMLVLFGLLFVNFLLIQVLYCYLACIDPVDPLILEPDEAKNQNYQQIKYCSLCKKQVFKSSYHCMRCDRCTFQMDHHNEVFNNCISLNNIHVYISYELAYVVYALNLTAQCVWLFILTYSNQDLYNFVISRIAIIVIGGVSFLKFLINCIYLAFTLYLRYKVKMTRIDYQYRDTASNKEESDSDEEEQNVNSDPVVSVNNINPSIASLST